jgi:alginate export protein
VQTGSWGNLKQHAGAAVGEAGWQPPVKVLKPWLSAGYSYGSGDDNPNDTRHGTFFQVLPTPRQYARFPFYNMMNNEDWYGALLDKECTQPENTKVCFMNIFRAGRRGPRAEARIFLGPERHG